MKWPFVIRFSFAFVFAIVANGSLDQSKAGQLEDDWPQWGGSPSRNNAPRSGPLPTGFDTDSGENILWSAPLGSETYGNPVVSQGRIFIGTNNGSGFVERLPRSVDLGVLLCLSSEDGKLLWQHSTPKLSSGRAQDWPNIGICCSPLVDGERLWYVTNRGEVVCLDRDGFHDNQNDGPFQSEPNNDTLEADVVWQFDMMKELGISQHNTCSCSITSFGKRLFINTGNGIDGKHEKIPAPNAASFLCLDRETGQVLWQDNSPGENILHGQWSSPAFGIIDGVEQVIFGGGDGWIYGFDANGDKGASKLLWRFDANDKSSIYKMLGATRLPIIGTPVIDKGLVYIALGEDPERGEGSGVLWCIDPTKRGDVSPTRVYHSSDLNSPIPPRRVQSMDVAAGECERPNPQSAAVWSYKGSSEADVDKIMHRTCGTVVIKDGLLVVADTSGIVHCLDSQSGIAHWTHNMESTCWSSPLIADGKIYIGDEDGDILVFRLSKSKELLAESNLGASMYTTPIVARSILYLASRKRLFAIGFGQKQAPVTNEIEKR